MWSRGNAGACHLSVIPRALPRNPPRAWQSHIRPTLDCTRQSETLDLHPNPAVSHPSHSISGSRVDVLTLDPTPEWHVSMGTEACTSMLAINVPLVACLCVRNTCSQASALDEQVAHYMEICA